MTTIQQLLTENIAIWTSADNEKKSGRGRSSSNGDSVYGIKKLRELILELAVRGKLVPQDPNDEPASELLKRIHAEKAKLIAKGKIKKNKLLQPINKEEIPFDLPQGWEWARLGFIGYTQTGATPSKSKSESFGADFPFIKPGDIYHNYINYSNEGLTFRGADDSGRIAQPGSLLMVCIGTIGKCNLIDRNCSFNQQINSITPYLFDSRYLLSVCRSIYFNTQAWSRSSSTTIAILNKGKWEEILIPIPSIKEQHRIVSKVEELMALCHQMETQHINAAEAHEKLVSHLLGTLTQSQSAEEFSENWQRIAAHFDTLFTTESSIDALKQTILQLGVMGKLVPQDPNDEPASELLKRIKAEKAKLVAEGKIKKEKYLSPIADNEKPFDLPKGWEWSSFPEIGELARGKSKHRPRNDPVLYKDGSIPLIQTGDVARADGVISTHTASYNRIGLEQSRLWPVGTMCITIAANIADSAILGFDACFPDSVVGFIPYLNEIDVRFYEFFLRTAKSHLEDYAPSTAQKNINLEILGSIFIPVPPLEEIKRIVTKIDELIILCEQLKSRIAEGNLLQRKIADVMVEQVV